MPKPFNQKPRIGSYYTYPAYNFSERDHQPLISVIVPIYNAGQYLDQALSSRQKVRAIGTLKSSRRNDGCHCRSHSKPSRSSPKPTTASSTIDKPNEGYGATCNRGIDEAHGEWISIIEPDDWIEQGMYAEMVKHASQFSCEADVVKTPYWRIENPDTPHQRKLHCSYARRMRGVKQPFRISDAPCLIRHHPSIWSAVYRKSFLDEHGIRFHPIPGAGWADNPFLVDTLLRAKNILYVDKAFYCYRADTEEQERSFHKSNPSIPVTRWLEMTDVFDSLGVTDARIVCRALRTRIHVHRGRARRRIVQMSQRYATRCWPFLEG